MVKIKVAGFVGCEIEKANCRVGTIRSTIKKPKDGLVYLYYINFDV